MDFLGTSDVLILSFAAMVLGMMLLVKGGDWTISGAVEIARHYGMPPLLVGFTIVAFGTSLPELIASINANLADAPGLAVGNVVGSNIANLLLIGGVSAMIAPLTANLRALRNDLGMMVVASIAWFVVLLTVPVGWGIGAASIGLLIGYVIVQYQLTKAGNLPADNIMTREIEAEAHAPVNHTKAIFMVLGGLAGLAIGAEFLIRGSVTTARIAGISDAVIGLTIVALGTSLPELTTCVIAALKKQSDIIIGNLVGSNVFNLMMILGSMGFVKTYSITESAPSLLIQDMPIMVGVSVAFVAVLAITGKLPRVVGGVFAALYFGYMILLAVQAW